MQLNLAVTQFFTRPEKFKNSFFPYCVKEWNSLGNNIRSKTFLFDFNKKLLNLIKTEENSLFGVHYPIGVNCVKSVQIQSFFWSVFSRIQAKYGKIRTRKNSIFGHFLCSDIKLLSRLRLNFSHLTEHEFALHESTSHYLLHCHHFSKQRNKNFWELPKH